MPSNGKHTIRYLIPNKHVYFNIRPDQLFFASKLDKMNRHMA